ncbi:MAG: efflux RND transporter periplasmic adaptor subunit [Erysipelotrichaceae bacterium]|nr:efflux RND transporter periplasmic adaptor subunit [Erysipelotrichaceae bacterium]
MKKTDSNGKNKTRKRAICVGLLTAVVLVGAAGCAYMSTRATAYQTVRPETGDITETLTASGNVKSEETKTIYASVSAPIAMLEAKEGDLVPAGEPLVVYDATDLTLEEKEASARMKQAGSAYASTVSQNEKNTLIYQGAEMTEKMFQELIAEKYIQIYQLQQKLGKAEVKKTDINALIARAGLDGDDDDVDDFAATIDAWRAEYDSMGVPELEAELARQKAAYSDMQAFRSEYAEQKHSADVRLIDPNAQRELLYKKEEAGYVKEGIANDLDKALTGCESPFRGIVTERFQESGAYVTEGQPLLSMANADKIYVSADISKYDIDKVRIGQRSVITIGNRTYRGTVTKIDRLASTENSDKAKIPVHVEFIGRVDDACLGIEADVEITLSHEKDVSTIPNSVIYEDENGSYVYAIRDGKVARVDITCGTSDGEKTEILAGLDANETVITDAITETQLGKAAKAGDAS